MVRSKRVGKANTSVKSVVKQILEDKVEHKSIASAGAGVATAVAGAVGYISAITQDDTINGRTGDLVNCHKLHFRTTVIAAASGSVRFVVFHDKFNSGTAPVVTDVLQTANYYAAYNFLNVILHKRFKIIDDYQMDLSIVGQINKHTDKTYLLKGKCGFVGTTNATASAGPNSLWYIMIGSNANMTADTITRFEFSDP